MGAKNSDHTISCLDDCIHRTVPVWVRHLVLVLDNAQVNKNQFTIGWMAEMVKTGRLNSFRLMLMVPGHTKFRPDEVFARVAHLFYRQDVFTQVELRAITAQYGNAHSMDGSSIFKWREVLPRAYKPVPQIKELHDFCWNARESEDSEENARSLMTVRKLCFEGAYNTVNLTTANNIDV